MNVQFINSLSSHESELGHGQTHDHGAGSHTHEHGGPGEHGHTHEHLENAGLFVRKNTLIID